MMMPAAPREKAVYPFSGYAAWAGAGAMAKLADSDIDVVGWAMPGMTERVNRADEHSVSEQLSVLKVLAAFCRANPGASGAALWRYAYCEGLHRCDPDDFEAQPLAVRVGYETFPVLVGVMQALLAKEALRLAAETARKNPKTGE